MIDIHRAFEDRCRKDAERAMEPLEKTKYLPRKLPDGCNAIVTKPLNGLRIGMPLDPPFNDRVVMIFINDGWDVGKPKISDYGSGRYRDAHKTVDDKRIGIELMAFNYREGSTCTIQSIGKKTVEEDVYEVVCDDGSKEGVFADE